MTERQATPAQRVRDFFGTQIWDVRVGELPPGKAALYRASRIVHVTARALLDDRLTFRAAALTYFTVLSVVPFLAFAFAVLKGFGAYRSFVEGAVRPYVDANFAANPSLHEAIDRILQFVDQTDVSRLGTVGIVFLVYIAVTLISNIEVALNEIFGARTKRPLVRQVTDYVTILVTGPILLLTATTFSAAAQSSSFVVFARETLRLGPLIDTALGLGSIVVVGVALFAMYAILPNVRVRPVSALVGAGVAALLWQGALVLHVQFQVGVARYNALYSVLGALPIFLVWTYVSWVIVLVGAQLAAGHQNEAVLQQRFHARRTDQAMKEALAVAIATLVARDFLAAGSRPGAAALADRLQVPPPVVDEILDALARAGLLVRAVGAREATFAPGRDLDAVRASDLRRALRHDPSADPLRAAVAHQLGPELDRILRAGEEQGRGAAHDLTLRELAALDGALRGGPGRRGGTDGPGRGGAEDADGEEAPIVDEKQPDVSG
jgi:membrane protein